MKRKRKRKESVCGTFEKEMLFFEGIIKYDKLKSVFFSSLFS